MTCVFHSSPRRPAECGVIQVLWEALMWEKGCGLRGAYVSGCTYADTAGWRGSSSRGWECVVCVCACVESRLPLAHGVHRLCDITACLMGFPEIRFLCSAIKSPFTDIMWFSLLYSRNRWVARNWIISLHLVYYWSIKWSNSNTFA